LHPSGVAKSSTSFGWGKGWNVTSAGWQVTLCDPIWHVSSSRGEACCELLYPVTILIVSRKHSTECKSGQSVFSVLCVNAALLLYNSHIFVLNLLKIK